MAAPVTGIRHEPEAAGAARRARVETERECGQQRDLVPTGIRGRAAVRVASGRRGYARPMRLPILALCSCVVMSPGLATTTAIADPLLRDRLLADSPGLAPEVLDLALGARDCAADSGRAPAAARLAVIDYSRPSTEPRLWLLDVEAGRVLRVEHVAHGRGSGENHATRFSNVEGSFQTSLGLYVAAETYHGGNGYSLRLDGLDPGFNDRARERLIVIHGAPYVDPGLAARQGRLGRSYGCPAVRPEVAREVIDQLKDGQMVFAYYPDPEWLASSPNLACSTSLADTHGRGDGRGDGRDGAAAASAP